MNFACVTLFPEMFRAITEHGVTARAVKRGLAQVHLVNPRDFATDKHRTVDDRPYGGGPGMLMMVEPLTLAIEEARRQLMLQSASPSKAHVVYMSPQGEPLTQAVLQDLKGHQNLVLVSGRYEGIDERIIQTQVDQEISLGDFVLSGGELAAMAVMDGIIRLLPQALGHTDSAKEDSFVDGLLDCPHYTRPEVLKGLGVPEVLLSGHHAEIERWRLKQSLGRTWLRRPDLLDRIELTPQQIDLLQEFQSEHKPN